MASETVNLMGYTLLTLILMSLIGYMVYQKVDSIQRNENFNLVYAASDFALLLDSLYASPGKVYINYSINKQSLDYSIKNGEVSVKKSTSLGPYAKKAYHRFSYSNDVLLNDSFFSFENKSVEFSVERLPKKILISNNSKESQKYSLADLCPVVVISKSKGSTDVLFDFPVINNANDERKSQTELVRSVLNAIDMEKTILHNSATSSLTFDEIVKQSEGKTLYLHMIKNPSKQGIFFYFKEQSEEAQYFSCFLKSIFSSDSNLQVMYGFSGDFEKFNAVKSKYVVVVEIGNEYGTSVLPYELSQKMTNFFGVFK